MEEEKKSKDGKIILSVIFIFFAYVIIKQEYVCKHYARFNIATTIKEYRGGYRGKSVQYYYYYKGKKIISHDFKRRKTNCKGGRYIVSFTNRNDKIEYMALLQNYGIPDSIKSAPPEGWDKIPDWVIPVYHGD